MIRVYDSKDLEEILTEVLMAQRIAPASSPRIGEFRTF